MISNREFSNQDTTQESDTKFPASDDAESTSKDARKKANFSMSRHIEMMNLCNIHLIIDFLDYYCDFLTYLDERKRRTINFNQTYETNGRELTEFYTQESRLLRSRRIGLRPTDFFIIKQIGQGGYGEVFLGRKRDTAELCALKKMSKAALSKMGEVLKC
jgi:hypothetical protein